jgi:mRNA interferase MazF
VTKNKIILIPFPFDDLKTLKVRPGLCLTDPIGEHHHIVVAFISSRVPGNLLESDILIDFESKDFAVTGLKVTSTLRLHRLMTVSTLIIERELGVISPRIARKVETRLKKLFELGF